MISHLDYSEVKHTNQIIHNLYNMDLPLHNRIMNFLNEVISLIYFDRATILFYYKDENEVYHKHSSISLNWEKQADTVKQYDTYYCQFDDTLPVFDQPSPIIFRSSAFFNQETRMKNIYWTDYLIPSNCIYSLEGNLQIKSNRIKGAFNFYRGEEKADFSEKDAALMALLQPHLSNVLKYYGEENDATSIFFMLENYNCIGVAMLDAFHSVIRSNSTYKTLIDSIQDNSSIINKINSLCSKLSSVKTFTGDNASIEHKFEDAPIFISVSKLAEAASPGDAQYICMIYDLSYFIAKTLDQTKDKYTLTAREFDILKAILKGKSNEEIASDLYLSLPTVKKYLTSIYSKMDIKNQKQIFEKLKLQEM